ncbi:MAG: S8 family serine peptidase [Cryobacterium sp.]|nr:S8 family serine peptidase [Oligoflexia bacterium]
MKFKSAPLSSPLNRRRNFVATVAVITVLSFGALGGNSKKIKKAASDALKTTSLKNWGIANAHASSHIDAVGAWTIEKGSKNVVVAVIDTGLDANHPDLKANVYHDAAGNYGYDFVKNSVNPKDDHGHGTHVAGIIGAISNPKTGVSGVAQGVSIMSVKYYADTNSGALNLKNTVKAIEWAVNNGAKVINYSGGGPEFAEEEYVALKKAESKGIVVVTAAGNEHSDTDLPENYYYPSAYRLTNIISVSATDINNKLIGSSNWGKTKVDVTAPGENIYSTLPNGMYGYMTGTSQATAFVSGIAALMLSKDPTLTPARIKEVIRASVDLYPELSGKVASGGRVNAKKALLALGITPPKTKEADVIRSIARGPSALLEAMMAE